MLRIVHPAPAGQGADPPGRRKGRRRPALFLTNEEVRHVRIALKNAARAYGGTDVLAMVMGLPKGTLYQATKPRHRPSGILAIRLAKAAGVSIEAVLSGTLSAAGRCETCGHRIGDGRLARAAGGAS